MSEKNRDSKNRWRNVTIAFRMSPEGNFVDIRRDKNISLKAFYIKRSQQ